MVEPGTYHIVNSELAPDGAQLAANFAGDNAPLIVFEGIELLTQRWNVVGLPGMPQTISPEVNPDFQAGPAGNLVEALPAANLLWNINNEGGGFTIGRPGTDNVWAINMAAAGQQILLEPRGDPVPLLRVWNFNPAPEA